MNGFAYDAAGNLLSTGFGVMQWDAENRIASASGATYLYDGDGNRVEVQSSGITDTYTFGGKPIARLKNPQVTNGVLSGGEWTDLIYGPNGLLAEVPGTQTAVPTYRVTDHLGTTAASLDQLGNLINPIDTAPFGRTLAGQTSDPYIFTGKERDTESGLDYFGARYYGSNMGRFMSPDPSGLVYADPTNPQSLNLYSYALNNPLRLVDPRGLTPCDYGPSDTHDGNDYEDADNDKECKDNGGQPIDYSETVNVKASGSSAFSLYSVESGFSMLIQTCPVVPLHLPSMDLKENIADASKRNPLQLYSFYKDVRHGGPQDYKQAKTLNDVPDSQGRPFALTSMFEDYGNFSYGATGAAQGLDMNFLLKAAGYAGQRAQGNNYFASVAKAIGPSPHGDDPTDQVQIANGYNYYKLGCD